MKAWTLGLFLAALVVPAGRAANSLLTFEKGVGVDPVSGIDAGAPMANLVRGVPPGGAPWRIAALTANIDVTGHITVHGSGLLLTGGDGIGTNGGQSVHAILFCGSAATATMHATPAAGVPLGADGDFKIDDMLSPPPPNPCNTPVLLIANPTPSWFAAGLLANDED